MDRFFRSVGNETMLDVDAYRWLTSPTALRYWMELSQDAESTSDALLKKLRLHLPSNQASTLLEQRELQALAKRKVPDPLRWFWTRQLLEQSSDYETAMETANDFPKAGSVLDICCGAGADSLSLAHRGLSVHAIDRCPIACVLAKHNASSHGLTIQVQDQSAEETQVDCNSFIHIDPDRRADGTRTSSLERLSPNWDTIVRLLKQCKGMSLKLAPGTRVDWNGLKHRGEQPPHAVRFLSRDGSVRQQRWYWGLDRWPENSITASMHLNEPSTRRAYQFAVRQENRQSANESNSPCAPMSSDWFHETFSQFETMDIEAELSTQPSNFVADYDPSIRAAEMSLSFAHRYGWHLVDSNSGYLTANEPAVHPMVRWFRVMDVLPLDKKRLKAYARNANVRTWELKSRGLEVDLNALRKILACKPTSSQSMTILCTKMGNSHRAIFCSEVF